MITPHLPKNLAAVSLVLAAALSAPAQTVPPAPSSASTPDAPLVLSPFEVKSETDTGYLATSAQSGTRLRTDLKDIANSISVVTKDFMNDIGATDLESLLVYTLGTEVAGSMGNFADAGTIVTPNGTDVDFDAAFSSASPSTRVRGLTSADNARDFFITSIPLDSYVTDRVEITRGANAMLFGLGSPSGIINNSLIKAGLRANRTEISHRTDQYASQRVTLDHNQVLLRDKLALRFAALGEKQYFRIEEAFEKDRRAYLTGTFRPFKNTTLRVGGEVMEIESNRPETRPPNDSYTPWWSMGRPAFNASTGLFTLLGTPAPGWPSPVVNSALASTGSNALGTGRAGTTNYISGQVGAITPAQRQMLLFFNDPASSQMSLGLPGLPGVQGLQGGNTNNVRLNPAGTGLVTDTFRGVRDSGRILNYVFHSDDISFGFWKGQQITDPAIYDFYHHMLQGVNKLEWAEAKNLNLTFEQLLLDGRAGIELAGNREQFDNGNVAALDSLISGYALRVDINSHLFDGTPNPNFGRPFVTAYSKINRMSVDRDAARATGFYDLDLRKAGPDTLGRILGRHRFTLSHTRQEVTSLRENGNFLWNNGLDYNRAAQGSVSAASSAGRGAMILRYLGPSGANQATPVAGLATPVAQYPGNGPVNLLWYNEPAVATTTTLGTWQQRTFDLIKADERDPAATRRTNNVQYTREKVNSTSAVLQSYLFNGRVVGTTGYRRDHVLTYNAGQPPLDPAGTGVAVLGGNYHPRPVTNLTEDSFNWGVVVHAPQFIQRRLPFGTEVSLHYNHSDNFRPAGQRFDLFDNPIPHETGETREYGVHLSTFNGKLVLRASHYETTSGMSSSLAGSINPTPINSLSDLLGSVHEEVLNRSTGTLPGETRTTDIPGETLWKEFFNSSLGQTLANTFRIAEGAPSANGRRQVLNNRRSGQVVATADVESKGEEYELIYNPTRQWRIAFNASKQQAVRTNVAPQLRALVFGPLAELAAGPAGSLRSNETNEGSTFLQSYTTLRNQMLPELVNEGAPSNELRKWRWNLVTNYTFKTDGPLRGFGVGAGVRWQDRIAYGFPIVVHPEFGVGPDVRNPHMGPTETSYNAWVSYRKKFKKFNWSVQLNVNNIGVGEELIPVSAQPDGSVAAWRIAPEQVFTLRNTISF